MYNWSVDEKQFKDIKEIINFLKNQPEVVSVKKIFYCSSYFRNGGRITSFYYR